MSIKQTLLSSDEVPHYTRPTSQLFSTAPFIATRLSPFFIGSPPDLEACKADVEGEVLINALRRLSYLPVTTGKFKYSSTSMEDSSGSLSGGSNRQAPGSAPESTTAVLLADTDSYIASLLFKPTPRYRAAEPAVPASMVSIPLEGLSINPGDPA